MSRRRSAKKVKAGQGGFMLFLFIGTILIVAYFWGSVQVDFIIRKNEQLTLQKKNMQHMIDDLRVKINVKRSYQRIVRLAKKQNMVFVSASKLSDLPVDLRGTDVMLTKWDQELNYAGITVTGLK